jgi:hypothetical protein
MLMSIRPVAVQVGSTTECEVSARYSLAGAYQVFITGSGVSAEIGGLISRPAPPGGRRRQNNQANLLKVRFKVAPDAMLGVRDVRIATPQGVSTLGQIVVVRDPVIREAANNDTMKTAQPIVLPATVCGAFEKPEDVDYFKFHARAGQGLTFHVQCQRLENRIHDLQEHADPILTLRNSAGTVLAANDNYYFGDPLLHYHFATAGDYYLEIRDVRYGGNREWQYSIEINDRPFVTNVYPLSVVPGVTTNLHLVGYNVPDGTTVPVTLPSDTPEGMHWTILQVNHQPTNAVPLLVSRLPEVMATDKDHGTPQNAQAVSLPAGINGRLSREGQVDCYAFQAKAGERITFEVVARAYESSLDSFLRVMNDKGQRLTENDDAHDRFIHADSLIENWTVPAGGHYVVEVRDLHLRGGASFVYYLKLIRSEPYFTLELDTDKTLLTPGAASVIFARASRRNGFAGEVQLAVDGLPPGVTANCGRVLSTGRDGCIILHADPTAKQEAANIRITGRARYSQDKKTPIELTASAQPLQEIYMPGGGRYHYPAEMHTISVSQSPDIKAMKISPSRVTLKPGESKRIDITIERASGFKGNVTLDAVYQHLGSIFGDSLPAGVTVDDKASQTVLSADQSKGFITLKAANTAQPTENQQVALMAHVSINFVMKSTFCGEPLLVTVAPR